MVTCTYATALLIGNLFVHGGWASGRFDEDSTGRVAESTLAEMVKRHGEGSNFLANSASHSSVKTVASKPDNHHVAKQTAETLGYLSQRNNNPPVQQLGRRTQEVVAREVIGFTLLNTKSGMDVATLSDGDVVDISTFGDAFSIRAETKGQVRSVVIDFDGIRKMSVDSERPYTLSGDEGSSIRLLLLDGSHTVSAQAFELKRGWGEASERLTISFTIVGSPVADLCTLDEPAAVSMSVVTDTPAYTASSDGTLHGELRRWHKITLAFSGPRTCERMEPNPFTYYRLDVTFTHVDGTALIVPGYYAADGNAANTGATTGDVWLVHFAPPIVGEWNWSASFKEGAGVAQNGGGSSAGFFDGKSGSFDVLDTNKGGRDHRGKGMLEHVGEHHLRFAGSGQWFLKAGPDSPENFLAYDDFDDTPNYNTLRKSWSPHAQDYKEGDPTWAGGRGTEIIGALNYLSKQGMNSFSFLTMNLEGDDKNVHPFVSRADNSDRTRFDVSKLAQWEAVFEHADHKGLFLHFKTQETENDQLLDGGKLGYQRKLYYRELIARFGHHIALNWNMGEENTNTNEQLVSFTEFFKTKDPYKHPVVAHTGIPKKDAVYTPLLGLPTFDGPSMQSDAQDVFRDTLKWVTESAKTDQKWVVSNDEQGPATEGLIPDADDPSHDLVRKDVLWGNIMAGGAGVEYYFGYRYANNDLTCQDFKTRENMWAQSRHALAFFSNYNIPFWAMSNANQLVSNKNWCLASSDQHMLVVYLRYGGAATIDLPKTESTHYMVKWYNPRTGGILQVGSLAYVASGNKVSIGKAPDSEFDDWVVLLESFSPPQLQGAFIESNGLLVMEMESQPIEGDWAFETLIPGFTGSGYYRMNGNAINMGDQGPNGRTSFFFLISNPGDYRLAIRSNKNNLDSNFANDCYTRMVDHPGYQGDDTKTYMLGPSNNWSWRTTHHPSEDDHLVPVYSLSAGVHELQISGRSKDFHIDRIALFMLEAVDYDFATDIDRLESSRVSGDTPTHATPAPTSLPTTKLEARATDRTISPSSQPTAAPFHLPTTTPSAEPATPSATPIKEPVGSPTLQPISTPSAIPTKAPVRATPYPSPSPSSMPTKSPAEVSTSTPSAAIKAPSLTPTKAPIKPPSRSPIAPVGFPTTFPSQPTISPKAPSGIPTAFPAAVPVSSPTIPPTSTEQTGGNSDGELLFLEHNGLVVMEMESQEPAVPDWVLGADIPGFTGSGYHRMSGNDLNGGDPNGRTSFFIEIESPGTYTLAVRSYKNNEVTGWSNDCYTRIVGHDGYQGNDTKTYMPGETFTWSWKTWHQLSKEDHKVPRYNLTTGIHELQVSGRSRDFHIDRIILYNPSVVSLELATGLGVPESARKRKPTTETRATTVPTGSPTFPPTIHRTQFPTLVPSSNLNPAASSTESPSLGPLDTPTVAPIGQPISSAPPTQPPHSASFTKDATFVFAEIDGLIVMEMESRPATTFDWVFEKSVADYTGAGYYRMDGNKKNGGDPLGRISFFILITNPGQYRLAIRSYKNRGNTEKSNDCYTKMVGHSGYLGNDVTTSMVGESYKWSWNTWHEISRNERRLPIYELAGGLHEFQISGRSRNFHVDRIALFNVGIVDFNFATDIDKPQSPEYYWTVPTATATYPTASPWGPTSKPTAMPLKTTPVPFAAPTGSPLQPSRSPIPVPTIVPTLKKMPTTTPTSFSRPRPRPQPQSQSQQECFIGDAGTKDGVIYGEEVDFFDDGRTLPSGVYKVEYVDGCIKYDSSQAWTVNAMDDAYRYWLVAGDSETSATTTIVKLPGTLGYWESNGGYKKFKHCVSANKDIDSIQFELSSPSRLGVWMQDDTYDGNIPGIDGRNPSWRLTLLEKSSPSWSSSPCD